MLHYDILQTPQITKQLTDFMKLYANNDMKYGGDIYKVIKSKLLIFYDCCCYLSISQEQYTDTFPAILKGRTLNFYYDCLYGIPELQSFQDMVNQVKAHFENEERS
jgi:hypothetical protein